jgi:hypothetical protein
MDEQKKLMMVMAALHNLTGVDLHSNFIITVASKQSHKILCECGCNEKVPVFGVSVNVEEIPPQQELH